MKLVEERLAHEADPPRSLYRAKGPRALLPYVAVVRAVQPRGAPAGVEGLTLRSGGLFLRRLGLDGSRLRLG